MTALGLKERAALPDALRILLEDFPREAWDKDPRFSGLVQFWLDRHLMFRRLVVLLEEETQAALDQSSEWTRYRTALGRYGNHLVGNLHGHHQIEDQHYFPLLAQKDVRLAEGFALLDADHHVLDAALGSFTEAANAVLQLPASDTDTVAGFHAELSDLTRLLDRHLTDEEELVVPVILKYGADELG